VIASRSFAAVTSLPELPGGYFVRVGLVLLGPAPGVLVVFGSLNPTLPALYIGGLDIASCPLSSGAVPRLFGLCGDVIYEGAQSPIGAITIACEFTARLISFGQGPDPVIVCLSGFGPSCAADQARTAGRNQHFGGVNSRSGCATWLG